MLRKLFLTMAAFWVAAALAGCWCIDEEGGADAGPVAIAVAEAAGVEIAIDSDSVKGDVEKEGEWLFGEGGGDYGDNGCLYAEWGGAACMLRWRPNLLDNGNYRVSVYFGGDPNGDHAKNAPFTVHFDGGSKTYAVDQSKATSGWRELGVHPFKAGKAGYVELTTKGVDGNVVADSVKFAIVR